MAQHGSTSTARRPDRASGAPLVELAVQRLPADAVAVTVRGEVDLATAPGLGSCLDRWLGRCRTLVVDLDGVRFLGAAGLNVLVEVQHRGRKRGVDLRLVCNTRAARRPLDASGLAEAFPTYRSVRAALHGRVSPGAA